MSDCDPFVGTSNRTSLFADESDRVDTLTSFTAVIVTGETVAAVTEELDWQQSNFVLVTFVSGVVGTVKFEV